MKLLLVFVLFAVATASVAKLFGHKDAKRAKEDKRSFADIFGHKDAKRAKEDKRSFADIFGYKGAKRAEEDSKGKWMNVHREYVKKLSGE
jgi:hypothetical protein